MLSNVAAVSLGSHSLFLLTVLLSWLTQQPRSSVPCSFPRCSPSLLPRGQGEPPFEQRITAARLEEGELCPSLGLGAHACSQQPFGVSFQWGLKIMSLLVDKKALMDIFLAVLQGIFLCVSVCLCVLFYRLM